MQALFTTNRWHRWSEDLRNYLALWVYAVGSAILAGHAPGVRSCDGFAYGRGQYGGISLWIYPWRETAATIAFVTVVILALRAWLGPRSRHTAILRWTIASIVFSVVAEIRILHRVTDQPGWYSERDSF